MPEVYQAQAYLFQENTMDHEELKWELTDVKHIRTDEWIDFREETYLLPDGTELGPFYSYSRRSYVVIIAYDISGNIICVRQFRYGIGEVTTEFVAGGIELDGETEYTTRDMPENKAETVLEAARRELLEESGYTSDDWEHIFSIPSNATVCDNYAHILIARNCTKVSGQHLDDAEFLNVVLLRPEEIDDLIKEGRFLQSVHVMAWLLASSKKHWQE